MSVLTYALLIAAICSVWFPAIPIVARRKLAPWLVLFFYAIICGLLSGIVDSSGLISLIGLTLFAWISNRTGSTRWQQIIFGALTLIVALALAIHRLPGFHNPVLLDGIRYSTNSAPFTLYANFDKGAVGLVLLALCCRRVPGWSEFFGDLRKATPVIAATILLIFGMALTMHFAVIDLKLPASTPVFMLVNLFFTVVAEEAFFRGFIQERLYASPDSTWRNVLAVVSSAALFGVAHLGGGVRYTLLATLAGLGYAIIYHRSRRIEGAIIAHFILNAAHYFFLSYPYLQ